MAYTESVGEALFVISNGLMVMAFINTMIILIKIRNISDIEKKIEIFNKYINIPLWLFLVPMCLFYIGLVFTDNTGNGNFITYNGVIEKHP